MVGGDWQNEPDALAATVVQSKFKAQIFSAQGPTTLQGSTIDYALASQSLAGSLSVRAEWDVPGNHIVAFSLNSTASVLRSLSSNYRGSHP